MKATKMNKIKKEIKKMKKQLPHYGFGKPYALKTRCHCEACNLVVEHNKTIGEVLKLFKKL